MADRDWRIATEAAELWMMPVKAAPTTTPRTGFRKAVSRLANSGISARGLTESLIRVMPYMSTAKPTQMLPMSFFLVDFAIMMRMIPTRATKGENDELTNEEIKAEFKAIDDGWAYFKSKEVKLVVNSGNYRIVSTFSWTNTTTVPKVDEDGNEYTEEVTTHPTKAMYATLDPMQVKWANQYLTAFFASPKAKATSWVRNVQPNSTNNFVLYFDRCGFAGNGGSWVVYWYINKEFAHVTTAKECIDYYCRHSDMINVAFADGHCEPVNKYDWEAIANEEDGDTGRLAFQIGGNGEKDQ